MGELPQDLQTPVYVWALMTNYYHIFLRSGEAGLSSLIVEEDSYLRELVRYIHLNHLRAGMVDSLTKLDFYSWPGHSALMGRRANGWQDCDNVLKWFGAKAKPARQSYR